MISYAIYKDNAENDWRETVKRALELGVNFNEIEGEVEMLDSEGWLEKKKGLEILYEEFNKITAKLSEDFIEAVYGKR